MGPSGNGILHLDNKPAIWQIFEKARFLELQLGHKAGLLGLNGAQATSYIPHLVPLNPPERPAGGTKIPHIKILRALLQTGFCRVWQVRVYLSNRSFFENPPCKSRMSILKTEVTTSHGFMHCFSWIIAKALALASSLICHGLCMPEIQSRSEIASALDKSRFSTPKSEDRKRILMVFDFYLFMQLKCAVFTWPLNRAAHKKMAAVCEVKIKIPGRRLYRVIDTYRFQRILLYYGDLHQTSLNEYWA